MGNCLPWKSKRDVSLLVAGIDNAGKTTVVHAITGQPFDTVAPTLGFSSEQITVGDFKITFLDLGGGERIRDIWKNYLEEVFGVVYVLDSSDTRKIEENKTVLENLLASSHVQQKPVLLLANKQDVEGAMDEVEICDALDLENLVNENKCPCRVEMCAAITSKPGRKHIDKNILTGFKWLLGIIDEKYSELKLRVSEDVQKREEKMKEEMKQRAERVKKRREERERQEKEEEEQQMNNIKAVGNSSPAQETPDIAGADDKHSASSTTAVDNAQTNQTSLQSLRSGLGDELMDDDYGEDCEVTGTVEVVENLQYYNGQDNFNEGNVMNVPYTSTDDEKKHMLNAGEDSDINGAKEDGGELVDIPEIQDGDKQSKKVQKKNIRKNQVNPVTDSPVIMSGIRLAPLPKAYSVQSTDTSSINSATAVTTLNLTPLPDVIDETSTA